MVQPAISFKEVTKSYGAFRALDGLSFSVQEGELFGLIGPNGAGKTTAIRSLLGLTKLDSGAIKVLGKDPGDRYLRQSLGYMPQETALYRDMTVKENLRFFGSLYNISPPALEKRITDLLTLLDLVIWGDALITSLSGGMAHRASLAVALLPRPKLLVLDEPTVGIDPDLRATLWEGFADMQKTGTTILITTHYMDEAMRCQRVGLINHGQLIAESSPHELIKHTGVNSLEEAFIALAGRKEKNELP